MDDIEDPNAAIRRNVPYNTWDILNGLSSELIDALKTGPTIAPAQLRDIAVAVQSALVTLQRQNPRPGINATRTKDTLEKASEVERIVSLFDLYRLHDRTRAVSNRLYSRIKSIRDSNENALSPGPCSLVDVTRDVIKDYTDMAKIRGINLDFVDKSSATQVRVPKSDLRKALGNLLDNGIKYMRELPQGSKYDHLWITISVTSSQHYISVAVESWGIPCTIEEYEGLFMFVETFRGHFVREMGIRGTGTGLTDVKSFAEKYGGSVTYWTEPVEKDSGHSQNKLTIVTLTLPIASLG